MSAMNCYVLQFFSVVSISIFARGRTFYNQSQTLDLFLKPQIFRAKAANQFKGYKAPFNINIVEFSSQTLLLLLSQFQNLFHPSLTFSILFLPTFNYSLSRSLFYTCNQVEICFHISSYFDHFILVTHIFCATAVRKMTVNFHFMFLLFSVIQKVFFFFKI